MTGRGGHITIGGQRVAVTEWGMTRSRPTPTDLDLLLAAVLAEPDEDTPRLAFADALDERGGPGDAERAEFIRVQVAMARMSFKERVAAELPVRQVDLIVLHGREWVPDGWLATANPECLEGVTRGAVALFRRGFVDAVACDAESWLRDADMILKDHPTLTRVTLTTMPDWSIVESPPHVFRSNGGAEYLRIQAVISWGDRPPRVFRHDAEIPGAPLSNVRARAAAAIRDAIRPGDWMGAADGWWPRVEFTLPPPPVEVGPDGGFLLPDAEFLPALLAATGSVAGDPIAIPPPPS